MHNCVEIFADIPGKKKRGRPRTRNVTKDVTAAEMKMDKDNEAKSKERPHLPSTKSGYS